LKTVEFTTRDGVSHWQVKGIILVLLHSDKPGLLSAQDSDQDIQLIEALGIPVGGGIAQSKKETH